MWLLCRQGALAAVLPTVVWLREPAAPGPPQALASTEKPPGREKAPQSQGLPCPGCGQELVLGRGCCLGTWWGLGTQAGTGPLT